MDLEAKDLEAMATTLERSGRYRVLRKLEPRARRDDASSAPTRHGLFLDLETTGLDAGLDEVIEIALLPFAYTVDGQATTGGRPKLLGIFCKPKEFKRIAMRADKTDRSFAAIINLAAAVIATR